MASELLINDPSFPVSGRAVAPQPELAKDGCPLIVAIHGGGFTHEYFDIPGYSLIERAASRGYGVIGIDRMGYGESRADGKEQSFADSRDWLVEAIDRLWPQYQDACDGVVLVGHSIGAALAVMVAAAPKRWPLSGVAVSGASLAKNTALDGYFAGMPSVDWIESGGEDKDRLMLGSPGTYDPAVAPLLHPAYRPVSTRELGDIYAVWPPAAPALLQSITVPVQFRMGEEDIFWVVDDAATAELTRLLSGVEGSSAATIRESGHAIDFHHVGAQFHDAQLDFARDCVRG